MDTRFTNGYRFSDNDTGHESTVSLEEDVLDLTEKINCLQKQVSHLNDSQSTNEVRYSKVKQENVNLMSKIHSLEEQLRDISIDAAERRSEEDTRHVKTMARLDREKSFECDQYMNRILNVQQELFEAKEESRKHQSVVEQLKHEKNDLFHQLNQKLEEIDNLSTEVTRNKEISRRHRAETDANKLIIKALNEELEKIKQPEEHTSLPHSINEMKDIDRHYQAMIMEVKKLRNENSILREGNEELQAQLLSSHLEEGRSLLKEEEIVSSLATEMAKLSQDELCHAFKEQKDCNAKLRAYIDGILLNIVENYPQLLEVKPN